MGADAFAGTGFVFLDLLADGQSGSITNPAARASDAQVAGAMFGAMLITWPVATAAAFGIGVVATALISFIYVDNLTAIAASVAIGASAGIAITYGLLPALFTVFADDDEYAGSDILARERGWERGRWGILGMAADIGLFILTDTIFTAVGYSQSPAAIATSIVTAGVTGISYIVAWALDISGIIEGYQESRRPRDE